MQIPGNENESASGTPDPEKDLGFCFSNKITLIGSLRHTATDFYGNIQRLDNILESLSTRLQRTQNRLTNTRQQLEGAKVAMDKPFPHEEETYPPNPPASPNSTPCWIWTGQRIRLWT